MEKENSKTPQILRMKEGIDPESYANNSISQSKYQTGSRPLLERAVTAFCSTNLPKSIAIADLGCSSGPNALFAISEIMRMIQKNCGGRSSPEFMVFLNDLPANDFNSVFMEVSRFREKMKEENGGEIGGCFVAGIPGSFHGRLFPSNSLHFVYSSSSLHWLSQVPPEFSDKAEKPLRNKGKIFISRTSPTGVAEAYAMQFRKDLSRFLRARAEEVVAGGRMVLTLRGRRDPDPCPDETCLLWDYLAQAFQDLVSQGLIEEEKLESYNTPYYEPHVREMTEEIEKEGSFSIDNVKILALGWDDVISDVTLRYDRSAIASQMAKAIRAVNESMIRTHFGSGILDLLFDRFTQIMVVDTKEVEHVSLIFSLVKKH